MSLAPYQILIPVSSRRRFLGSVREIVPDIRLLWTPNLGDGVAVLDDSPYRHTINWDANVAGRITPQGDGYLQSFVSASSNVGTVIDKDAFSFGTGAADSAFSLVTLANVTDTAAARVLAAKWQAAAEWLFYLTAADLLLFQLMDQSVPASPFRTSNAAPTQGALKFLAATYSAATGGATAANDVTLYQDAAVIASTATNVGTYVAMENTNTILEIGATSGVSFLDGSMGFLLIAGGALGLGKLTDLKTAQNRYFRTAL